MAYRQLVNPNLDPYIRQGNSVLTDWYGWCLAYVQSAYAVGWSGSNAWEAWSGRIAVRHADRNIPGGVYVPIWFSGYGGLGHVAIYKDGQVWSSPWHHKPYADVLNSIEETERIYGVRYEGWSEDLAGRQLIENAPDPVPLPLPVPIVIQPEPILETPPSPYVPPAPPITAPQPEKYKLVTTVKYYGSLDDAKNDRNALRTVAAGEYFVFATDNIFKNLSTSNMDDQNKWINILENKAVVTPPTTRVDPPELTEEVPNPVGNVEAPNWRGTLNLGYAGLFVFIKDTPVVDLEGKHQTKYAKNGDYLQISGKFTGPDGHEYARPINKPGYFMWYGVPVENLRPYDEVYSTKTTLEERQALHT